VRCVRSEPVSGVGSHNSVTVRVMMVGYADRRGQGPLARRPRAEISPIGEFDQHLRVTPLRRAPADEVLAAQLVQRRHERRLPHDPCAVFRDHLVTRAVTADHERIA
jgi:hypothetical protein